MSTHRTYYNYRGRKTEYDLTIDPSNEKKWNELLQQLDLVIQKKDNIKHIEDNPHTPIA